MKIYYEPRLKKLAQYLRNNSTYSEVVLWNELKGKNLGFQFMRQKPIGRFIVDFYCSKLHLAIELDGEIHQFQRNKIRDRHKSEYLTSIGIHLLRFTNFEVLNNTTFVLKTIKEYVDSVQRSKR